MPAEQATKEEGPSAAEKEEKKKKKKGKDADSLFAALADGAEQPPAPEEPAPAKGESRRKERLLYL